MFIFVVLEVFLLGQYFKIQCQSKMIRIHPKRAREGGMLTLQYMIKGQKERERRLGPGMWEKRDTQRDINIMIIITVTSNRF